MEGKPIRFIGEPIEVVLKGEGLTKKPGCPEAFDWHGERYPIVELLSEWHDYSRRGKMAHNMRPDHLETAKKKGSWGVGRDYYRVRTASGQVFDLYYDRAPRNAFDRKGGWWLFREMETT